MNQRLAGLRVVNTRAIHQAAELDQALIAAGAIPLSFPCIEIVKPDDVPALDAAMAALDSGEFDWVVFTSVNAVFALDGILSGRALGTKVAAIGPSTAQAAEQQLRLEIAIVPEVHTSLELAMTIPIESGDRVLLPTSGIAGTDLERSLEKRGAIVTRIVAYNTVPGTGGVDLRRLLANQEVDALTFASPSAIHGLLARFERDGGSIWDQFGLPAVCIGTTTFEAAIDLGFTSVVAAVTPSVEGVVAALESVFAARP